MTTPNIKLKVVVLVRHGEYNGDGELASLSEEGRLQVIRLGDALKDIWKSSAYSDFVPAQCVFVSSKNLRALQTSGILAHAFGPQGAIVREIPLLKNVAEVRTERYARDFYELIREYQDAEGLVISCHEPHLRFMPQVIAEKFFNFRSGDLEERVKHGFREIPFAPKGTAILINMREQTMLPVIASL